ncbi:hypothetical protein BDV96DRAFT_630573 [Lophiotrema nucula]|uniref:Uncharacterized protein n=1 Tax=Lophiotrema nucula TaxID=690887 RepID=A0A6A5ZF49_9PLEO|nr:hypothetical protein BDV96DRAFT_630573 [Lophiotrema nucula]
MHPELGNLPLGTNGNPSAPAARTSPKWISAYAISRLPHPNAAQVQGSSTASLGQHASAYHAHTIAAEPSRRKREATPTAAIAQYAGTPKRPKVSKKRDLKKVLLESQRDLFNKRREVVEKKLRRVGASAPFLRDRLEEDLDALEVKIRENRVELDQWEFEGVEEDDDGDDVERENQMRGLAVNEDSAIPEESRVKCEPSPEREVIDLTSD